LIALEDQFEWFDGEAPLGSDWDEVERHSFTSSCGRIELQITMDDARSGSHQGACDDDVRALSQAPYIAEQLANIDPVKLASELEGYGAWDAEQLADHDQNLQRILWLACGYIAEEAQTS
jgi:hypothetical protein